MLYTAASILVLLVMFPFLWLLVMSFKPIDDIFAWPPKWLFVPTVEHYVGLWDGEFRKSFFNSLVTSVGSTVFAMVIGVPGAYALSRMGGAGGNGTFGRRTMQWQSGGEVYLSYEKRNVLGFSMDFAEDFTKSNWEELDYPEWQWVPVLEWELHPRHLLHRQRMLT